MSLPDFFFDRVSAEIRQQMDGVQALADQLARLPLAADAQGCVAGIAEAAAGVRRTLERALELRATATQPLVPLVGTRSVLASTASASVTRSSPPSRSARSRSGPSSRRWRRAGCPQG